MRVVRYALICGSACSLIACSAPTPVAQNFPLSYQAVARTAKHWDVVADDVVAQTSNTIGSSELLRGRPVYVDPASRTTAFDSVFRDFMVNHLVERSMQVSVCPTRDEARTDGRDVRVHYETHVINHAAMPHYRPGVLTALAGGVFVGRMIGDSGISRDAAGVLGFGTIAAADLLGGYMPSATKTELVVTTTIEENNRFLMRRSDVYYVPDGDRSLFTRRAKGSDLCRPSTYEAKKDAAVDPVDDELARRELALRDMCKASPPDHPTPLCTPQ